jgi:hypothetical protein
MDASLVFFCGLSPLFFFGGLVFLFLYNCGEKGHGVTWQLRIDELARCFLPHPGWR